MCGTGEPLVQNARDIDDLPPPHRSSQGRWPIMLESVRQVRRLLGEDVFIVACFDQFPFSLACAALGTNQLMLKLVDDRSLVLALLERCSEYTVAYARALGEVGADMLSGGDSPAGLIGPKTYREVALPYEKRVIEQIRLHYAGPVSLHICGNATPLLADMATSGADVLELEHQVDLAEACRTVEPDVAIWGNLDPVRVLAQGRPDDVRRAAGEALTAVGESGHRRFILSSGCTLAMETPTQNLHALVQAAASGVEDSSAR